MVWQRKLCCSINRFIRAIFHLGEVSDAQNLQHLTRSMDSLSTKKNPTRKMLLRFEEEGC